MPKRKIIGIYLNDLPQSPVGELCREGWNLLPAAGIESAKYLIGKNPDCYIGLLAISDWNSKNLEKCEEFLLQNSHIEWIALLQTGCLQSEKFCKYIFDNFYDYHTLPLDMPRLLVTIGRAYGKAWLKSRLPRDPHIGEFQMIGVSPVMQELYSNLRTIQNTDSSVLICGESGTGKELAARAIHYHSSRCRAPFVTVNCGVLPRHLIRTELFGYEKGALTGAIQRKVGRIEAAEGGTVFLDEIVDLPMDLQGNLLRFLQEKTIERIGSNQSIKVDVRVIAATRVNLQKAVEDGRFRADLFYRLNVLNLKVPSLRERNGDIELLARTFFEEYPGKKNHKVEGFSQQALHAMSVYDWPGNVRELMNRVRSAMIICAHHLITPSDLGLEKSARPRIVTSLDDARDKAELEAIQHCLQLNNNNVSKSARDLGVSRVTLYRLINKFRIAV